MGRLFLQNGLLNLTRYYSLAGFYKRVRKDWWIPGDKSCKSWQVPVGFQEFFFLCSFVVWLITQLILALSFQEAWIFQASKNWAGSFLNEPFAQRACRQKNKMCYLLLWRLVMVLLLQWQEKDSNQCWLEQWLRAAGTMTCITAFYHQWLSIKSWMWWNLQKGTEEKLEYWN